MMVVVVVVEQCLVLPLQEVDRTKWSLCLLPVPVWVSLCARDDADFCKMTYFFMLELIILNNY